MLRHLLWVVLAVTAIQAQGTEPVTVANFVRAETDTMFRGSLKSVDGRLNQFYHSREPIAVEQQTVIRTNRDTLYSGALLDLSSPVTVTLPEAQGRYMSLHVINQDHFMFVESEPGQYTLDEQEVGTRFAMLLVRTFVDPDDARDVIDANKAQDGLAIAGGGPGPFTAPDWDQEQVARARSALNDLAVLGFDPRYAFGRRGEVNLIDYFVGAGSAWGGLPSYAAMYVLDSVELNDGSTAHKVSARDVPVNAFWSVTVYNSEGYLEPNDLKVHSFNSVTATQDSDGAITIHFGSCDDGRINCIPISAGWNYVVRLYEPAQALQEGDWEFPAPEPLKP